MHKERMICVLFRLAIVKKNFESPFTSKNDLAVTRDYRSNGIGQPINVEGHLFVVIMNVSTKKDHTVKAFAIIFFNLIWVLVNVAKIVENFTHCRRSPKVLYGFVPARNSTMEGWSAEIST